TDYRLAIYNMIGQQVRLFTGHHDAGDLEIVWDGRSDGGGRVASGMYLYRFQAGSFTDTRKMVLLK
ncbi:MAG: FlgD immunoglobulin-like domain containing protein, partial [Candidatus Zixiibacteriota bacterium]